MQLPHHFMFSTNNYLQLFAGVILLVPALSVVTHQLKGGSSTFLSSLQFEIQGGSNWQQPQWWEKGNNQHNAPWRSWSFHTWPWWHQIQSLSRESIPQSIKSCSERCKSISKKCWWKEGIIIQSPPEQKDCPWLSALAQNWPTLLVVIPSSYFSIFEEDVVGAEKMGIITL